MKFTAAEVGELFERLGACGATLLIQVDHSLVEAGSPPWEVIVSGPAVHSDGICVRSCSTFQQCLQDALRKLRSSSSEWAWLDAYFRD
jgi:hypothetical protein